MDPYIYLGLEFEFGSQRIRDLAFVFLWSNALSHPDSGNPIESNLLRTFNYQYSKKLLHKSQIHLSTDDNNLSNM